MRVPPLPDHLATTALAFRGYDVANLGRTAELLEHPAYGPVVEDALREASDICRLATGRPCNLVSRVRQREETRSLDSYAHDVALIVGTSIAQIRLLETRFGAPMSRARLAFGYSLGEASALIASGSFEMKHLLRVPLTLADDCVALADGVVMGVLFSRGPALEMDEIERLCIEINQMVEGVIGVSAILTPNCVLLLGQGQTLDHFAARMRERLSGPVTLRRNPNRWPPLHTPITWQRAVPNRAAVMLHAMPGGLTPPPVPILSSVTGKLSYGRANSRQLLHQWVDHPQRLWDQIVGVLSMSVRTVVHVGPAPNLIPATFKRVADGVQAQLSRSMGRRMVSRLATRPWLAAMLPGTGMLLRAPMIQHINLEDWLLDSST